MQTLNNAELAFLSVLGHQELTTKVLRLYAKRTYLFTPMFHPHLNVMWDSYVALLTKYRDKYGLSLSPDIIAAGLSETVQNDARLPAELKQKCDALLQKLLVHDVPDMEHGTRLIKNLVELDNNRKMVSKINESADLLALQQTLDASKRTMEMLDTDRKDDSVGSIFSPLRDIRKLATHVERIPTGINWLDAISSGGGRSGELWLILGPSGGGKCLGKDTPILMADGHVKKVQDITVGEQVMGADSTPRNVVGITRGRSKMYRIHAKRGESFICNDAHVLTLVSIRSEGVWIDGVHRPKGELVDISVEDFLKLSKDKRNALLLYRTGADFPQIASPRLDPYFVGLYLGDGCVRNCKISTMDEPVIDYCTEYVKSLGLQCKVQQSKSKAKELCFSRVSTQHIGAGPLIHEEVLIDGVKRIKDSYKLASRENRLRLMAGIIDSDGYAHHGGYDLVLKGKELAEDVTFVARSLGYAVTLRPCIKKCCNTGVVGTYYRMNIAGDMHELPLRVPRRISVRRNTIQDVHHVGFAVEPLPEDDYFGFQLDGDGRFLLGDFTVTHNSTMTVQYACGQALLSNNTLWATYEQTLEGDLAERMIANITDTSLDNIRDVGFDNLPAELQNKFWSAVGGVDDRLIAVDMTIRQPDPSDSEDYGGAASLWRIVKEMKADGHAPKTLVLDWFGSMMSKISSNLGLDLDRCYRFKAQEEILKLKRLAKEEDLMVIVFHQLSTKASDARPTYLANSTEAQDMKSMRNYFDLVGIIGVKDVNDICYFSNPKARKGGRVTKTLHLIGDRAKFVMEDGWLPNSDGNFYKPGTGAGSVNLKGTAEKYSREID